MAAVALSRSSTTLRARGRVVEDAEPIALAQSERAQVAHLGARDAPCRRARADRARRGAASRPRVRARACATARPCGRSSCAIPETRRARGPPDRRGCPTARGGRRTRRRRRPAPTSAINVSARMFATTRSYRAHRGAGSRRARAHGPPVRVGFVRASGSTAGSTSSATTRRTPSRGERGGQAEPVPTSSALRTAPSATRASISSRQVRVVACCPVPNAMPGSITRTSRPGASGTSQGGATGSRRPIAIGTWWARNTPSVDGRSGQDLDGAGRPCRVEPRELVQVCAKCG